MQQYRKNLGKVSLTAEGAWNLNDSYDILSIVYDEHTQHGFISRKAVPQGVDLYNKEYWMPLNVSGYADNNVIILSKKTSEASIQSYTLEEAITSIKFVGRRPGAILGFYNENNDRLDIGGRWELWQFNDTNIYNWENVDSWQNLYYNYNKFMGWFKDENFLNKYAPFPEIGCYAFVGSEFNEATVYRCDNKYVWNNTTQHTWDYVKVIVDGNVTVGENGNWFNNGEDTGIPASVKGENGKTPIIRNNDNILEVSYDNVNWEPISDEIAVWLRINNNKLEMTKNKSGGWEVISDYISAWFRWQSDGGEQITSVGKIQITRDGVSWTDLSGNFVNHLRISKYIGAGESLPTSGIAEGTIYAKGPTYDTSDTSHSNPIYRLWVYAWKDNTLAWQDNGEFTSIAAGIVQETGNSETEVMSQKAVTKELSELDSKLVFKNIELMQIDNPIQYKIPYMIDGGYWQDSDTSGCIVLRVEEGDNVIIRATSIYYTLLSDISNILVRPTKAIFATGYTDRVPMSGKLELTISGGAKYLYIWQVNDGVSGSENYKLKELTINDTDYLGRFDNKVNSIVEKRNFKGNILSHNFSTSASYIRQISNGSIIYKPKKWISDFENCTFEICFKRPADIVTSSFLFAYNTTNEKTSYISITTNLLRFVDNDVILFNQSIAAFEEKETIRFTIRKSGDILKFYINGKYVHDIEHSCSTFSDKIYVGSWITETVQCVTDYYYAVLTDDDGTIIELINAGSEFEKFTAEKYIIGKRFSSSGGSIEEDNDIQTEDIEVSGIVSLEKNTHLRGNGCVLKIKDGGQLILTDGCSIEGFTIEGESNVIRESNEGDYRYTLKPIISKADVVNADSYCGEAAIVLNGQNASIINCSFKNIDRTCVEYDDANAAYTAYKQPSIRGNHFYNCRCAIRYSGEFANISNNVIHSCVYGCLLHGGNLNMSSCHFVRNDVAIVITGDKVNAGHSQFNGIEVAHSGIAGLYIVSLLRVIGNVFSGCQFADAPIIGIDCNSLLITGSRLDTWVEIGQGKSNAFIANIFRNAYADRDGKPLFGGGAEYILKNNIKMIDSISDSEINN